MRALIQVVKEAQVAVNHEIVGSIGKGLLILFGAHSKDTPEKCIWLADKIATLRVFPEASGKMNLSLQDAQGELLIVSQFTLYADCSQGRRPSFTDAAPPPRATELYEKFVAEMRARIPTVKTGKFGAHMEVSLINDGPRTFIIDTPV